ncbi:nicotinic acid mononucleotide adenyltransferase [Leeuwenhoekiella palythoae]|uniref:nicotinic acid mononucleotide adenyltransferase n=1 Tax=Leeuwenhoekiella palythoae TaxID=573501 RepID=UPI001CE0DF1C|nr:nicotinic acid mononucleotide adenyltransferase [Leeuwenhoekiella palythoae]UBZ11992.1 nicotinic acid mononucleotide adenyltransferase [Leeuwenhoekiella palythoae]
MRTIKLLSAYFLMLGVFTSCYTDVFIEDDLATPVVPLSSVLADYELWYVDIDQTQGNGTIPFMDKAFTFSFLNGTVMANNNLAGIGDQGSGFGIEVGYYDIFDYDLDISHDIDGFYSFEVSLLSNNAIELYNRYTNTSYVLIGYQRSNFDYDRLFYDNIHFFLQEYTVWEKVHTSLSGTSNAFDAENYLQFLPANSVVNFRSSQDPIGSSTTDLYWDYSGIYEVNNVVNNAYLKTLTLDYDYFANEYFELSILDDATIALYHPASGSEYRFRGRGYIQYKTPSEGKSRLKQSEIEQNIKAIKALAL